MKRSEFKALVKEAMMEILPELMEIMAENIQANAPVIENRVTAVKPDLNLIRAHASRAVDNVDDYALDENGVPVKSRPRLRSNVPQPENPRELVGGEYFASGKGIMEWFAGNGGAASPVPSEFNHSEDQMAQFMRQKFGVG